MASLLSAADKAVATGAMGDLFDTFNRNIVIFKESKITYTDTTSPQLFGYNERSNDSNVTYTQYSGVYPALITHNTNQDKPYLKDISQRVDKGEIYIKVKTDARDFIENGKTLNISADGFLYKIVSHDSRRNFLSSNLCEYYLERVL